MMASDEIGKGDTISREQAIAAVLELNATADYSRAIAALRALPSVAPDPIEAEYREAAVALAEAWVSNEPSIDYSAALLRTHKRFAAAKSAREGEK